MMYLSGRFARLPFPPSYSVPYPLLPSLPCSAPPPCIHSSSHILQAPSHHLITHPVLPLSLSHLHLLIRLLLSSSSLAHHLFSPARPLGATPTPLLCCLLPQVLFRLGVFVEVLSLPLIMKTNHVAAWRVVIRLPDPRTNTFGDALLTPTAPSPSSLLSSPY